MDIYSLYGATMLTCLVAGGAMTAIALGYRQVSGFLACGLGCLLIGLQLGVTLLRLAIPGKEVIFASNVLLAIGLKYWIDGIRVFRGRSRVSSLLSAVLCLAFLEAMAFWLYIDDRRDIRVGVASALAMAVLAVGGVTMMRRSEAKDRVLYRLIGGVFLAGACCFLMRSVAGFKGLTAGRSFDPYEVATLAAINVWALACGFGLLTASNLRFIRQIEELAMIDPLTQLPNRRFFEERFLEAGRRASRRGRRLALVYMDIDGFKKINDMLGHAAGDAVLKAVARRIQAGSRESDCVARLGGDEFVLLLEDAGSRSELAMLMRRLKDGVAAPVEIAGHSLSIGLSCGLAVFPDHVEAVEELVRQADLSMYEAKRGRVPVARS